MRKSVFWLVVIFMGFLLVGCGPSFDEEGAQVVEDYSNEIIPAVEFAVYMVEVWAVDQTADNFNDLYEAALDIEDINAIYWADDKIPSYDIDEWHIMMSRGDQEWEVVGEELADAIYDVEWHSHWLAELMIELYEAGGDVNVREEGIHLGDALVTAMEHSMDAAADLRRVYFNR